MIRLAPRHSRFTSAFAVGVILALVAWAYGVAPAHSLLIGADGFFLLYLALMALFIRSAGSEALQRHAAQADYRTCGCANPQAPTHSSAIPSANPQTPAGPQAPIR